MPPSLMDGEAMCHWCKQYAKEPETHTKILDDKKLK